MSTLLPDFSSLPPEGLLFHAKAIASDTLQGLHQSNRTGASIEFAEHKEYSHGDDLRHLDWKLFAKKDRFYVRRYEHESVATAELFVDSSGSMQYGAPASKHILAAKLSASIAYLLVRQHDRVGLSISGDTPVRIPAATSQKILGRIVSELEDSLLQPRQHAGDLLGQVRERLAQVNNSPRVFIVTSDFFYNLEELQELFHLLVGSPHEVYLVQILHPDEVDFPFKGATEFVDLERHQKTVLADGSILRNQYLQRMHTFQQKLQRWAKGEHMHFQTVTSNSNPVHILRNLLGKKGGE